MFSSVHVFKFSASVSLLLIDMSVHVLSFLSSYRFSFCSSFFVFNRQVRSCPFIHESSVHVLSNSTN